MVAVSAPGKLILMGEHGAVYGLPALTAALDLRVRADLDEGVAPGVEMDLADLGLRLRTGWADLAGEATRARRRWREHRAGAPFQRDEDPAALARLALGEAALDEAATGVEPAALPPLSLRLRSDVPVGAGFGSSAAVAVALVAGFVAWRGGRADAARVERLALEVERRQHGRPSGVDHGTVLRGGVQWAARDAAGELRLSPVAAAPELLAAFEIYDSGPPAESTGAVVAAVGERRRADPAAFDAVLARMRSAVDALRAALEGGGAGAVAPAVTSFQGCLEEIGVVPRPIRRAVRRLEAGGAAAKVSGAGALTGEAAGCLLVWPAGRAAEPPRPAAWRRVDSAMGGPGLRLEAA